MVLGIIAVVFLSLGVTGMLSVILGVIGLICASNAKKVGFQNGLRTAGFVLSLIGVIGGGIVVIYYIVLANAISSLVTAMGVSSLSEILSLLS